MDMLVHCPDTLVVGMGLLSELNKPVVSRQCPLSYCVVGLFGLQLLPHFVLPVVPVLLMFHMWVIP